MRTLVFLLLLVIPFAANAQVGTQLSWLVGNWQATIDGGTFYETWWTVPGTDELWGYGRQAQGRDTIMREDLRIFAKGDTLYYSIVFGSKTPLLLPMKGQDGSLTRGFVASLGTTVLTYTKKGRNAIDASLARQVKGQAKVDSFPFHRVN
jgi:hypothetical protein